MRQLVYCILLLFAIFPTAAFAENVTVPANRTSPVTGFWVFGEQNCHHPGRLKHRVSKEPAHGKVTVKFDKRRIPEEVSKRCAGRTSGVMIVFYTPDRGYRGKDKGSVSFQFPKYQGGGIATARTIKFSVTVK